MCFLIGLGKFLDEHNGALTAVATIAIAAFTLILWRATTAQGRLTEQVIALARDEFVSTHRPRIILREAIIGSLLEGEPISVLLHFANTGETVGKIIRSTVNVENVSGERLLLHPSVELENDLGEIALKPGGAMLVRLPKSTPAWEREKYEDKMVEINGKPVTYIPVKLHLVGQFVYVDQSGVPRRTAFRRMLLPERQRFYRIPDEPDLDYVD